MALALQSRASEVFAVDIHPGARIGACGRVAWLSKDVSGRAGRRRGRCAQGLYGRVRGGCAGGPHD